MIYDYVLPKDYYAHSIVNFIFLKSNIWNQQLISEFSLQILKIYINNNNNEAMKDHTYYGNCVFDAIVGRINMMLVPK